MAASITPTIQQFYTALAAFISSVTGLAATNIVQGLGNRAAMPKPGLACFEAINRKRLWWNVDTPDETSAAPATTQITEGVELTVQIDFYGPLSTSLAAVGAADWANMLSATLRDAYGCAQFTASLPQAQPLYADEAQMSPLDDSESQYEERWSLDARFQVNFTTTVTQDYAQALDLTMINVEEQL